MGLDACVYKNKANLPFDVDALGASFDPATGEYFFEDVELDRKYPHEAFKAISRRLGNIAAIAELREELAGVLDNNSVVMSKVIYSGSHAGDFLPLALLASLESELSAINEYQKHGSELITEFVANMRELIAAARREGNPIVF
ncbi:MAG TPA: hypothetical protein VGG46_05165 [Terriglobales bacterium]|jgi:hypothetical protein